MGQVVVLGGTGHIGAAIARAFAADGADVVAVGRSAEPRANLAGTTVVQRAGDDRQAAQLAGWCAQAEVIVDAATPYPLWRHGAEVRGVVADARRRMAQVIRAAQQADAALVHISSFTTLPPSGSVQDRMRLATLRGMHPYFELKEKVEQDVRAALRSGLRGAVVNPSACFGPYDLKAAEQAYIPMLLAGKVAGTLRHRMNVVDVRDVARGVTALVAGGYRAPQLPIFGHNIRVDELSEQICDMAGVPAPRLKAPLMMTLAGAYWAETAAAMVGRKSAWPSLPMLLTGAGHAVEISPAQQALGVAPRALSQTLADALAWYRQIGRC